MMIATRDPPDGVAVIRSNIKQVIKKLLAVMQPSADNGVRLAIFGAIKGNNAITHES